MSPLISIGCESGGVSAGIVNCRVRQPSPSAAIARRRSTPIWPGAPSVRGPVAAGLSRSGDVVEVPAGVPPRVRARVLSSAPRASAKPSWHARILKRYAARRGLQTPPTTRLRLAGRGLARSNRLTPSGCATNDLPAPTPPQNRTGHGVTCYERAPTSYGWLIPVVSTQATPKKEPEHQLGLLDAPPTPTPRISLTSIRASFQ